MARKFNKGDIVASYLYGHFQGTWKITGYKYDRYYKEWYYDVKSTHEVEPVTTTFAESRLDLVGDE